jgi:hypothetical protein
VHIYRLNVLKFLQWGCKNGERSGGTYDRRGAARREASGALLLWRMNAIVEDLENASHVQRGVRHGLRHCLLGFLGRRTQSRYPSWVVDRLVALWG